MTEQEQTKEAHMSENVMVFEFPREISGESMPIEGCVYRGRVSKLRLDGGIIRGFASVEKISPGTDNVWTAILSIEFGVRVGPFGLDGFTGSDEYVAEFRRVLAREKGVVMKKKFILELFAPIARELIRVSKIAEEVWND